MLGIFKSRRMLGIGLLGISSGLPFLLTSRALQIWMVTDGVDLSTVGFVSLLSLPYSLKFLWSPFLDRFTLPGLGRRKGWILLTQILLVAAIGAMFFQSPKTALTALAVNAFIISFLSATQDISVDAYRVDSLSTDEAPAGASVAALGYRVALILTGSLAFLLAEWLKWPRVYLAAAGVMAAIAVGTLWVKEPGAARPPETLREAVLVPFQEFLQRMGRWKTLWVLSFVVLFRLGDALLSNMASPFLIQTGFSQSDVGLMQGGLGLFALLAGAITAGSLSLRVGLHRCLWICGGLQALSNLAYFALALVGRNYGALTVTVVIENFCGGLGTAALVGYMTTLCNPSFSATQYALLSSLVAAGRDLLASPAGKLAEATGWSVFFLITFVAALPALLLLPVFAPWSEEKPV